MFGLYLPLFDSSLLHRRGRRGHADPRMPRWLDKTEKTPNLEQLARLSVLFSACERAGRVQTSSWYLPPSDVSFVRFAAAFPVRVRRGDRGLVLAKIMATLPSPRQSGQSVKEGVKRDYIRWWMVRGLFDVAGVVSI